MLFNTVHYLIFLVFVVLICFVIPKRMQNVWLLLVSCYFYMQRDARYIILLFSNITLTYLCGRIIGTLLADAEKNFLRYALFVSFFLQLVAGTIERSKNLLVQLV